jgi:hypothetical protein
MSNLQVTFEAMTAAGPVTVRLAAAAGGIVMWVGETDPVTFNADAAGELAGAIDLLAGGGGGDE